MTFDEVLEQVRELLQSNGRVAYRALKRRFELDDDYLEDLKAELIDAEHVAVDEDGKVLVWKDSLASSVQRLASEEQRREMIGQILDPRLRDSRLEASERRQLTVMFCDLVGSTALSEQLDPEEYSEVVRFYQETCTYAIRQYDGRVAQHLGDGLLVYFGYPVAHEDDAQRAVRAGLEITSVLRRFSSSSPWQGKGWGENRTVTQSQNTPHPRPLPQGARESSKTLPRGARELHVRIGIHTGLVVIGQLGSSEKREILALGETPNLAARIQGMAQPDEVVISAATYHLVEGLFTCEDRGQPELKGISTPLTLYRVVKESEAHSRFEVVVCKGLTPLIGRDHEFGLLCERWERVKEGAGQVVLLSGEPGIGKSRLVEALKETVEEEGARCLELRCSPYAQNSALQPVIEHLQRTLHFRPEETAEEKLRKLEAAFVGATHASPLHEHVPLFAALLSLPHPEGYPLLTFSPQKQKEKTTEALAAWLCAEAKHNAATYAWEDLHWADPSTLEFLTLFLDQIPATRLLTVLTFRPDFTPPWRSRSHINQLTLNRLGRHPVESMVEKLTGGKPLPREVVQQIVAKTDGVPLFVEELTKSVVESVGATHASPLPLGIPATLQDALMARLDRLGTAKEIAQVGATLGREFSYELLQAVAPLEEATLQQGLGQLVDAELLYQRGLPPQATYRFKHALVQDTAYQSLLKSKRQQLHQQIAQVLEKKFPEIIQTQPELLAQHYTEGGLSAQAIPYWQRAGERATRRSANTEAVAHLTKGLELVTALPPTSDRDRWELALQIALGTPLIATKGWGDQEIVKAFARARELCDHMGDTALVFPALYMQWGYTVTQGKHQAAQEVAERFVEFAERQGETAPRFVGHGLLGRSLSYRGELVAGRTHIEKSLNLYDPQTHRSLAFQYGQDPRVANLSGLSWILWVLGYPEQARQVGDEAVNSARTLGHAHTLVYASSIGYGIEASLRRDVEEMEARLQTVMDFLVEQGFSPFSGMITYLLGWLRTLQEPQGPGIAQMLQGRADAQAIALSLFLPYSLTLLADAYARSGQIEQGFEVLAEALTMVEKNDERWAEAEVHRVKGELLQALSADNHREAESCFQSAITIARRQKAKSWELRASTSLARLWQQQGRRAEAHKLLSEIYGWFTEGFDTKDLQKAKALLKELHH